MNGSFDVTRWVRESVPIAVILGFWTILSMVTETAWLVYGLRGAGIVMAGLYVWVRATELGDELADGHTERSLRRDPVGLVERNVGVAVAAGGWFLAALLLDVLMRRPGWLGEYPPVVADAVEPASFALSATGLGTVFLYARSQHRSGLDGTAGSDPKSPGSADVPSSTTADAAPTGSGDGVPTDPE